MDLDNDQLRAPSPDSLAAGYETSTVSVKGLALFVIGLILVGAIVHAGIWFLFQGYLRFDRGHDRPNSALLDKQALTNAGLNERPTQLPPPPPPRIQPNPVDERVPAADLKLMYDKEDQVFQEMGWTVDKDTHTPHISPAAMQQSIQEIAGRQSQGAGAQGGNAASGSAGMRR